MLGFRVQGLGCGGFRVQAFRLRIWNGFAASRKLAELRETLSSRSPARKVIPARARIFRSEAF